jgi:hypothetical protein
MTAAIARRTSTRGPWAVPALWLLLVALLAGCVHSARFVGDYDEILDRAVMDLQVETNQFFARMPGDSAQATDAMKRQFLEVALGSLEAMAARASVLEEGLAHAPLSDNLEALREQYEELRSIDLSPPPVRESMRRAFHDAFRSLQIQLVTMKKARAQRQE